MIPRACQAVWLLLLLAATGAANGPVPPGSTHQDKQRLELRVEQLRRQLGDAGDAAPVSEAQAMQLLELADALQLLNHMRPDGGRRLPEAEAAYRRLLGVAWAPQTQAHIRSNLASLLLAANRATDAVVELDAALQHARHLHQQQPGVLAGMLFNKGKALAMAGDLQAADDTYLAAAAAAAGADCATYGKALAAMRSMPQHMVSPAVTAAAQGRRALALRPGLAFLERTVSSWPQPLPRAASKRAPVWISSASNVDVSWLHFALWKFFDLEGEHSVAWAYLAAANQLMRASVEYSPEMEQAGLAEVLAAFPPALFASSAGGYANASLATPIFVVGLPRSGSTLLEQLLGSHSWVWAAGEDTALAPLVGELNQLMRSAGHDGTQHSQLLSDYGRRYLEEMRSRVPLGAAAAIEGSAAADAGCDVPSLRVVDKMLRNLWLLGYIRLMLPTACVLLIQRHPLDTALSCYAQPFGYAGVPWAWDLNDIAAQVEMASALAQHWVAALPGWVHVVRYEALVWEPEATARRVLRECGLPWEPGVLQFHKAAGQRPVATASMAQVREPLYNSSIGRWRRYQQQLAPLAQRLQPLVVAYEAGMGASHSAAGQGTGGAVGAASTSDKGKQEL